jgi:hypothetical protein
MPAPTIDPTISIQAWVKGRFNAYQPAATDSPTSWAAVGLPAGVTISTTTGLIQGTPTVAGVFNVKLTATNAAGTSQPVFMAMGIESNLLENGAGIEVNIELETGFVHGVYPTSKQWAMYAKSGDTLPIFVGFTKGGVLQSLPLALLRFGLKEFESETLVPLNDGAEFEQLGSFETTRYRLLADFDDPAVAAWLANYETDGSTHFLALGEIEAVILEEPIGGGDPIPAPRSSQTFRIFIEREMIPKPTS